MYWMSNNVYIVYRSFSLQGLKVSPSQRMLFFTSLMSWKKVMMDEMSSNTSRNPPKSSFFKTLPLGQKLVGPGQFYQAHMGMGQLLCDIF